MNNHSIYESTIYPSGAQCSVFLGDLLLEESAGCAFSVVQAKAPHYAYNSQLFGYVAKGTVLVQGVLTIAFRHEGYLITAVDAAEDGIAPIPTDPKRVSEELRQKFAESILNTRGTVSGAIPTIDQLKQMFWPQAAGRGQDRRVDSHSQGLGISLIFGNPVRIDSEFAVRSIRDLHFTGHSVEVGPDERPIYETYSFISREAS